MEGFRVAKTSRFNAIRMSLQVANSLSSPSEQSDSVAPADKPASIECRSLKFTFLLKNIKKWGSLTFDAFKFGCCEVSLDDELDSFEVAPCGVSGDFGVHVGDADGMTGKSIISKPSFPFESF